MNNLNTTYNINNENNVNNKYAYIITRGFCVRQSKHISIVYLLYSITQYKTGIRQ